MKSMIGVRSLMLLVAVMFFVTGMLAGAPAAMATSAWRTSEITATGGQKSAAPAVIDSNGIKHIAWVSDMGETAPGTLYYANSSNFTPLVIATTAGWHDPSIFVTASNDVYLAWVDKRNGPNGDGNGWDVYYATSADNWVNHLVTAGPTVGCKNPLIAVGADGNIHIAYIRSTTPGGQFPYDDQLFYVNSFGNWDETRVSNTPYSRIGSADMALASDGAVHLAFSNDAVGPDPDGNNHIYYANSATTWTNRRIDDPGTTNFWDNRANPVIAAGFDGVIHIAWEDHRNTDPNYGQLPNRSEIYYANSATNWYNTEIAAPYDGGVTVKTRPSLLVDPAGLVHLAWLQRESPDYSGATNLYYGNAADWQNAERLTDLANDTVCIEPGMCNAPVALALHRHALIIDDGKPALLWQGRDSRGAELFHTIKEPLSLGIITAGLPRGAVNNFYSAPLAVDGGMPPYSWQATNLPDGLIVNNSEGTISGVPTAAGGYLVTLSVTDSYGIRADKMVSLIVDQQGAVWTVNSIDPSGPSRIDWSASQHDMLTTGSYLKIVGTYYYVAMSAGSSMWNGIDYNWADLQQCDQGSGTPLMDGGQPLWANLTGTAGLTIELYSYWPAQSPYGNPELLASGPLDEGPSVNSLGEVVWSQYDEMSGRKQIFSSIRGQLTFDSVDHYNPAVNNLGDLVWAEYSNSYPYGYTLRGVIGGQTVTVATSQNWFGKVDLNDRGEIVWSQQDGMGNSHIFSNLRGQLTSGAFGHYNPSINNQGDVVFTRFDPMNSGPVQIYKLAAGESSPVAVTNDTLDHNSPAINDNGEILWAEKEMSNPTGTGRLVSSLRGMLLSASAFDIFGVDLNNCGDVAYITYENGQNKIYRLGNAAPCVSYPGANDIPEQATPVAFGGIFTGLIDSAANPVDWYRFEAVSGDSIHVTVNFDNRPPNTLAIGLYDGNGNLLSGPTAFNPLGINATASYSGAYFLKLEGQGRFGYAVSLSKYTSNCGVGPCPDLLASGQLSGPSVNSLGEVVWSQYDQGTGRSQVFSSTRGQLTSDSVDHYNPAVNNLGDLVWMEYGNSYPYSYTLRGVIGGQTVTLATSQNWFGKAGLNDRGEVVWSQQDSIGSSQIYSSLRGQLTGGSGNSYDPSINNQGDVVFTQYDSITLGPAQVYKLAVGSMTPVAVTNDALEHRNSVVSDSGEIVWAERDMNSPNPVTRLVSSVRGALASTVANLYGLDANNCGDMAYITYENEQNKLYRLGNAAPCVSYPGVNDVPELATPVAFGGIFTGLIDSAANPVDWYRFEAATGDSIHITVNFDNRPPNMLNIGLYDGNGNLLSGPTAFNPLGINTVATYSGVYFLKVEGQGGRLGYAVSLSKYTSNCGDGLCPDLLAAGQMGASPSINSLVEVVWTQFDQGTGRMQVFSSTRGQLTFDPVNHTGAAVNNLGDLVWTEYNESYPYGYTLRGIIAGQQVTVTTSQNYIGEIDINDRGEVVWDQQDSTNTWQIFSNFRGQLTSGAVHSEPSINNQGDVVFIHHDPVQYGPAHVYKLAAGETMPVAVTNDTLDHRDPAISDSGEIVWAERDMNSSNPVTRLVSNVRGALVSIVANFFGLDVNNCGNMVYMTYENEQNKLYRLGDAAPCVSYPGANDAPEQATPVTFGGVFTGLIDSAANPVDWYRFDATADNNILIRVNFDNRPPNALTIGLYDGNGSFLSGPTGINPLVIDTTAPYGGAYYLKVEGLGGRFGYAVSLGNNFTGSSQWTVSSYFQTNPGYWDSVQWPGAVHEPVSVGNYLRIDGTYYYVTNIGTSPDGPNSFYSATLANCDQNNGAVYEPANFNDAVIGKQIELAAPPAQTFIITATSSTGGSIDSAGAVLIAPHGNQTFTIQPDPGYQVLDVQVNGYSVGAVTSYYFSDVMASQTISVTFGQPASNDDCAAAKEITGLNYSDTASTEAASIGFNDPAPGCGNNSNNRSAWYKFTAPSPGTIAVNTFGSNYDTILSVYTGSCGLFAAVSCNDDSSGLQSSVTVNAVAGVTYYFQVSAYQIVGGALAFNFSFTPLKHSLNVAISATSTGRGSVSSNPAGISLSASDPPGTSRSFDFIAGSQVTLTAEPDANSVFNGWSGACSGTGSCVVTMDGVKSVTANFGKSYYLITANADLNGSISESGAIQVPVGNNKTFNFSPNPGYRIADVVVDGASKGALSSYTFPTVSADHAITVSFVRSYYTVMASAGASGSISESGAIQVPVGSNKTFSFTPNSGYRIADLVVDGVSKGTLSSYTFPTVSADHTITVTFVRSYYMVTAVAGTNGTISESGVIQVAVGNNKTFTFAPDAAYRIQDVVVDGISKGPLSSYTFSAISADHALSVSFVRVYNTVAASAGANGSISQSGAVQVPVGNNKTFIFAPNAAYRIQNVVVDGIPKGPLASYTFPGISADHAINVSFVRDYYTITASAGANGTISQSGAVQVPVGNNKTFYFSPNAGYRIQNVVVDGISKGPMISYTFPTLSADHTLTVSFISL